MSGLAGAPPGAKARDYWFTVFATDPVALPLVRLLARRRWVTPDQVSMVALALGLAVGPVFALGTRAAAVAGAIVFYGAFLFDCVDGKLARALDVTSPRGEAFDHLSDGARRASGSLGLTMWLWRADGAGDATFWWAVVYAVLAYYFLEVSGADRGEPASGVAGRWSETLARRRLLPTPGMPDVQALVFILGPVTGLVVPGLGLGSIMVGAGIAVSVRRRMR
ncbi:MAG: CDP-alcohol phosphatidyltransferase family protein [Actinomycetota bacterium]